MINSQEQKLMEMQNDLSNCKYQLAEQRREMSIFRDYINPRLPSSSNSSNVANVSARPLGNMSSNPSSNVFSYNSRTVTNQIQDEFSTGLSTRIFARGNFWKEGYLKNRKQAEILDHQSTLDSIQGIAYSTANKYGLIYNYLIHCSNHNKLELIDEIIDQNEKLLNHFENLYYSKLIDYSELLKLKNTQSQYTILKESHELFNNLFKESKLDTILPSIPVNKTWEIDFQNLIK